MTAGEVRRFLRQPQGAPAWTAPVGAEEWVAARDDLTFSEGTRLSFGTLAPLRLTPGFRVTTDGTVERTDPAEDDDVLRGLVERHGYKWVKMMAAAMSGCCSHCNDPRPPGVTHEHPRPTCTVY